MNNEKHSPIEPEGLPDQPINETGAYLMDEKTYPLNYSEPDTPLQPVKDEMTNKKLFEMAEKCFSELPPGVQAITNHNAFIQGYCASYAKNVFFAPPEPSSKEQEGDNAELTGEIIDMSGFTQSNRNHIKIEVLGQENYIGNNIKLHDKIIFRKASKTKP